MTKKKSDIIYGCSLRQAYMRKAVFLTQNLNLGRVRQKYSLLQIYLPYSLEFFFLFRGVRSKKIA
jgi:hypothetical protein